MLILVTIRRWDPIRLPLAQILRQLELGLPTLLSLSLALLDLLVVIRSERWGGWLTDCGLVASLGEWRCLADGPRGSYDWSQWAGLGRLRFERLGRCGSSRSVVERGVPRAVFGLKFESFGPVAHMLRFLRFIILQPATTFSLLR